MAVDTAQKRRSMISFGRMNYAERVPAATNFDSAFDRAQAMWLYAGLDISTVVVPGVGVVTWRFAPTVSPVPVVSPTYSPTITMTPS